MKSLSKMNNDVRLNVLREAALELQEVCNFNPPFRSKGKTEEEVTKWLKEASVLLEPTDQKKISEDTEDVLTQLGVWPFAETVEPVEPVEPVKEPEEEAEDNSNMENEINIASSVRELKDIAKTNEEFKSIRGNLASYKKTDDLRQCMLAMLNPEGVGKKEEGISKEDEKERKEGKKSSTPEFIKKEEKQSKEKKKTTQMKKVGVITTIVECVENADSKKGISKEEILEVLKKNFPDRDVKSMKNTINVQVPNRIFKEKFPVKKLETGNYCKE